MYLYFQSLKWKKLASVFSNKTHRILGFSWFRVWTAFGGVFLLTSFLHLPSDLDLFLDVKQSYKTTERFLEERKRKNKFGEFRNMMNHFTLLELDLDFSSLLRETLTLANVDSWKINVWLSQERKQISKEI